MFKTEFYRRIIPFSINKKQIIHNILYSELTQNNSIELTSNVLRNALKNILKGDKYGDNLNVRIADEHETYDYVKYINFMNKKIKNESFKNTLIGLGQIMSLKKSYPYSINPYNIDNMDKLIQMNENIITTQNKKLLFNYGDIINNEIYVCTIEDILLHKKENISDNYIFKLYFPGLYNASIKTKEQLLENRNELFEKEQLTYNDVYQNYHNLIDLYHETYDDNIEKSVKIHNHGIKNIHLVQHPYSNIKIPLELVFKIINSNKFVQIIKYNPGKRKENIYRLFTGSDNINVRGEKIPVFTNMVKGNTKERIEYIINKLAKNKSIGLFYQNKDMDMVYNIYENGDIELDIDLKNNKIKSFKNLKIIIDRINNKFFKDIFAKIRQILNKISYNFVGFKNIDNNTEIINIDYQYFIKDKKINFWDKIKYLSPIIKTIGGKKKNEYIYYRVSNFEKASLIDNFIGEKYRDYVSYQGDKNIMEYIIDGMMSEIRDLLNKGRRPAKEKDESKEEYDRRMAKEKLKSWLTRYNLDENIYVNKSRKININSGFKMNIVSDELSDTIEGREYTFDINVLSINHIDNLNYLDMFNVYIPVFLKIMNSKKDDKIDNKLKELSIDKSVTIKSKMEIKGVFNENIPSVDEEKEIQIEDDGTIRKVEKTSDVQNELDGRVTLNIKKIQK